MTAVFPPDAVDPGFTPFPMILPGSPGAVTVPYICVVSPGSKVLDASGEA